MHNQNKYAVRLFIGHSNSTRKIVIIILIMIYIYRPICPNISSSYVPTQPTVCAMWIYFVGRTVLCATSGQCPRYYVLADATATVTYSSRLIKKISQLFAHKTHFVVCAPLRANKLHNFSLVNAAISVSHYYIARRFWGDLILCHANWFKLPLLALTTTKSLLKWLHALRFAQEMREKKNWFKRPKRPFFGMYSRLFVCLSVCF